MIKEKEGNKVKGIYDGFWSIYLLAHDPGNICTQAKCHTCSPFDIIFPILTI